jgi:diguanylate cyclase (GGDEF)-like protein/PAS domain S-box-containing protein
VRLLPALLLALGVTAAMLALADHQRAAADDARRVQVRLERIRALSTRMAALTWQNVATADTLRPGVAGSGVALYRGMVTELRAMRALEASPGLVEEVETGLAAVYAPGTEALMLGGKDPDTARRIVLRRFAPAIERLDETITDLAERQGEEAVAAQRRARRTTLATFLFGLSVLALLGARLNRASRRSALAEQAREAERRGERRLRAIVRHASDVIIVADAGGHIQWITESVEGILGHRPGDVVDRSLTEFIHPDDAARAAEALRRAVAGEEPAGRLAVRVRAADGGYRQTEVVADNRLADPDIGGVLLSLRDVSERADLEARLRHQAFHDSLTGLANRELFEDRLVQALARTLRRADQVAVLFIDLDDFKTVNDSLGHAIGDDLLRMTSARLQEAIRAHDTAARLGGDEFAVLLEDLEDAGAADAIAERVRRHLAVPVTLGGRRVKPSASIGLACAAAGAGADEVLGNADVAMYAAKERGKGQVVRFEPSMRERVVERLELTADLEPALLRDELFLEYQPVVDLRTGQVTGVEALLRWLHPQRGRLTPDRFIGLAESSGAIVQMGLWVLRNACAQLRRWDDDALEVSVNVSTRQLADPGFPADVRAALEDTGVAPERLTLEITEHLLADDGETTREQLAALKEIGVLLAVDDFGTGYSALSYLQAFPLDVLKVDRSFVQGIDRDAEKARLVQGIVEMGHNLGMTVVAEGIEEPGEAALLREFRAGRGQGYLFARPVPADAIPGLLARTPTPGPGAR